MKILKAKSYLSLCLSALVMPFTASAKAVEIVPAPFDDADADYEQRGVGLDDCAKYLELNEKPEISQQEWEDGVLLEEIIGNISSDPIDYCMSTSAKEHLIDRK